MVPGLPSPEHVPLKPDCKRSPFLGLGQTCQDVTWHICFSGPVIIPSMSVALQPGGCQVPAQEHLPASISTCCLPCWLKVMFKEGGMKSHCLQGRVQAKLYTVTSLQFCGLRRPNPSLERLVRIVYYPACFSLF